MAMMGEFLVHRVFEPLVDHLLGFLLFATIAVHLLTALVAALFVVWMTDSWVLGFAALIIFGGVAVLVLSLTIKPIAKLLDVIDTWMLRNL